MTTYRAGSAQQYMDRATSELGAHLMNPDTGQCVRCGESAPCELANGVFARLRRYLDAVPTTTPPYGAQRGIIPPAAPLMTLAAWIRTTGTCSGPHRAGAAPRWRSS